MISDSELPVGGTPLVKADRFGKKLGLRHLFVKNDAVCFPTLSFKDRVVAVALAQARAFGFEVVSCSSTGNLANAVAAQAARMGFQACIFIPADLEAAKVMGTQVFGAQLVRIAGQLRSGEPSVLADCRTLQVGLREYQPAALLRRGIEDGRI